MFDVLVHATPPGHAPARRRMFLPGRIPAKLVFDMVYNPLETLLLRKAKSQGSRMRQRPGDVLEQAVRQFEIFTGDSAPRAVMERAALEALAQMHDLHNGKSRKLRRREVIPMQSKSIWMALVVSLWAATLPGAAPAAAGSVARGGADALRGLRRRHFQCPPAPRAIAVRAGRLFDSKTGQMLTNQVVLLSGERITEVGPGGSSQDSGGSCK